MESLDWHSGLAALEWQVELGADECISDAPINRYDVPAEAPKVAAKAVKPAAPVITPKLDVVAEAQKAAQAASNLDELKAAMAGFEHCDLKKGAQNLVFSDGIVGAPLMVVGEAPGREEDIAGKPFIGAAGAMLDRMLGAIDVSRTKDVYITNVIPWRPPSNRDPKSLEIAMMQPFLMRHIALAAPKVLIAMGNISCQALLDRKGVTRLRGTWAEAAGLPLMPMFHPAYLLRNPAVKREAWADLLDVRARLKGNGP